MAQRELAHSERLKALLQPDVVIPLNQSVAGPLDLLRLRQALTERICPGTRESLGPEKSIQCLVRFKSETWAELNGMAERLRAEGTPASPSQLASLLIEAGLAQLQET